MKEPPLILLVQDNADLALSIQQGFGPDYRTILVKDGAQGLIHAREMLPDVIIAEVTLPILNGIELCRTLKNDELTSHIPIILLTAKGSLEDKVAGLDAGADDYLTKPFEVAELRARFRALSRKVQGYPKEPLVVADLTFDPNTREVRRADKIITLSKKETFLLEYLMKNHHRTVTRSMIANSVWDTETNQYTNVIDVFINHLRKKIDGATPTQRLLHTIRGKGFRLTDSLESGEE